MGTRSLCSLQSFLSVASGLQSVAVELFFHFVVTYSARLIFHFCVADLIATQNVPTQPVPLSGRRKYFQNVRHLYFERVLFIPSEASRECLTCFLIFSKKKKKTLFYIPILNLLSTSSSIVF